MVVLLVLVVVVLFLLLCGKWFSLNLAKGVAVVVVASCPCQSARAAKSLTEIEKYNNLVAKCHLRPTRRLGGMLWFSCTTNSLPPFLTLYTFLFPVVTSKATPSVNQFESLPIYAFVSHSPRGGRGTSSWVRQPETGDSCKSWPKQVQSGEDAGRDRQLEEAQTKQGGRHAGRSFGLVMEVE